MKKFYNLGARIYIFSSCGSNAKLADYLGKYHPNIQILLVGYLCFAKIHEYMQVLICSDSAKCSVGWAKNSADHILRYFSYFPQKISFDISCKNVS